MRATGAWSPRASAPEDATVTAVLGRGGREGPQRLKLAFWGEAAECGSAQHHPPPLRHPLPGESGWAVPLCRVQPSWLWARGREGGVAAPTLSRPRTPCVLTTYRNE